MKLPLDRTISAWFDGYRKNEFVRRITQVLGYDILVKASGFVLIPVYLRLMTQDEYGSFNFIVSIVQMLGLLLTLGLCIPLSKLYHTLDTTEQKGAMLFTIVATLVVFIFLVVFPVFALNIDFWITKKLFKNDFSYNRYRYILLIAVLVTIFGLVLIYYLFASEQIGKIKSYNKLRILFTGVTIGALVIFNKDAVKTRLIFTYGSELLLIIVFGYYFVRELVFRFNWKILWKCLLIGLPIMFTTLCGIIVNFSDKFFLEKYGVLKDLSTYYLAFSFASVIPLISASLQNVWMPEFMKERDMQRNSHKTKKLITRLVAGFIVLATAIWVMFFVLIRMAIIPAKYSDGMYVLPLLLMSQIFMAVTVILNNYLIYFEKTHLLLACGIVVSLASVGLSVLLIPKWSIYGAAYTSLISNILYLALCSMLVKIYKRRYLGSQQKGEYGVVEAGIILE
ncbi:MAG TPA: polysaccharide biosynthesis C-terminal domain-containing protein [Flavisolibacter sp.]|nr:polysaccharide biosynthesis C-terminal domain-containing protein [Flavisolibacter sp.]